jgi:outer membrane receptor protein involved in Fe transport
VYSYFRWPDNFSWILGLSVNDYSSQSVEGTPVNPKFGLMWTPFAGTTVRAAAFRTFRRDLISDQTIEPTEIAGFNQFFDDPAATRRHFPSGGQRFAKTSSADSR